ncbi:hypothetical protein [Tardiphaga sp. P9-11]|jgi:hypothetical protein|uniref:hypothetical protein n=1 Tax=Tardiphaga sp. P9-11 TaxID=2024614 RepID=UPI0011F27AD2|nr:hypothetical protein [Tardiphaga sp. P9-11]KAA0076024.1 hypothetical protein CIW50_07095 [Tardiphaga sp. P9-11]
MKRFLLFLLLGPAVGFAVFELREIASGRIIGGFPGFIMGLPFAYWFGLIPSLVMWLEDWFLEDKMGLWPKVLTSALTGYVVSIGMMLIWTSVSIPLRQILTFGIVGAVQGAVCSWLSGVKTKSGEL